jgi:tRNA threonylcarbamoyladenosine biosynthesis protein TsaB
VIVLGFDTATSATAVALRLADGTTLRARDDPAPGERPGHTARLLPLADDLLARAGLDWSALQRIAVGVGPGTFTGLRVGVATARGLAQSLGVEVVGVGTLEVLARAALRAAVGEGQQQPHVLAAIDARRGEAFAAAWGAESGGPPRELAPPRALAPADLAALPGRVGDRSPETPASGEHPRSDKPRRPDQSAWLAVGDGALRFREHLEAIAVAVPEDASPLHRVDAGVVCELALDAPAGALEAVLPDYRRRPDAEIALQRAADTGKPQ